MEPDVLDHGEDDQQPGGKEEGAGACPGKNGLCSRS